MRKIFILILVLMGLNIQAQTIDSTFKGMISCKIIPFKAKFSDTLNIDHLGVQIISDNLSTNANLYWALIDSNGVMHIDGILTIQGDDYKNWSGSNLYPFQFVAKKLNIVFIKPNEN